MLSNIEALVGQLVGGYRLERILGRGGVGAVFAAHRDDRPQETMAIKILIPPGNLSKGEREEFRRRFLREAEVLLSLDHPNILKLLGYGEEASLSAPYLVLPFMAGGSLADRAKQGRPALAETVRWISAVAAALDYAHGRGIIHRDIKPANVLLDARGEVYLADFGIVKIFDAPGSNLTVTGEVIGTPEYMSPEQAHGDQITAATDIYSLGMMAYQFITGQVAFQGRTLTEIIMKVIQQPPPPPRQIEPNLPIPLETALLYALAKNPRERFRTAGAFAQALSLGVLNQWPPQGSAPYPIPGPYSAPLAPPPSPFAPANPMAPPYPPRVLSPGMATPTPPPSYPPVYQTPAPSVPFNTPGPSSYPPAYQTPAPSVPRSPGVPPTIYAPMYPTGPAPYSPPPPTRNSGPRVGLILGIVAAGVAAILVLCYVFGIIIARTPTSTTAVVTPTVTPSATATLVPTATPSFATPIFTSNASAGYRVFGTASTLTGVRAEWTVPTVTGTSSFVYSGIEMGCWKTAGSTENPGCLFLATSAKTGADGTVTYGAGYDNSQSTNATTFPLTIKAGDVIDGSIEQGTDGKTWIVTLMDMTSGQKQSANVTELVTKVYATVRLGLSPFAITAQLGIFTSESFKNAQVKRSGQWIGLGGASPESYAMQVNSTTILQITTITNDGFTIVHV